MHRRLVGDGSRRRAGASFGDLVAAVFDTSGSAQEAAAVIETLFRSGRIRFGRRPSGSLRRIGC
jgi:hypothetical protein